jgi:V-type H+-transporting ATPase subunit a
MVFRVSRGNAITHYNAIPELLTDPITKQPLHKVVFSVVVIGEQLRRKTQRIIQYFGGVEYDKPSNPKLLAQLQRETQQQLAESRRIVATTDKAIQNILNSLIYDETLPLSNTGDSASPWLNWLNAVQHEKLICDFLRKCEREGPSSKFLISEGWVPADSVTALRLQLNTAVKTSQSSQPAVLQVLPFDVQQNLPPTHFKLNKFTSTFQAIVDTYGVPRYKEVNPGLFTVITFPFLFGVMYGDIGHGTLLTIFAAFLLYKEKQFLAQERRKQLNEIFSMAFAGRYLLLMMGLFAVYCGWIYNDCMSVAINAFGSTWEFPHPRHSHHSKASSTDTKHIAAVHSSDHHEVYPFGIDPAWHGVTNELAFFNSFKMKLSVTLGVTQMIFGIILGAANDLYFGDKLAFWFEFVPRLVFMLSTFGYMIFLIIYKLSIDWANSKAAPPNLVQTMISMFLSPGNVEQEKQLYPHQAAVQLFLLFLAFASVPVLLFAVPCLERRSHQKSEAANKKKETSSRPNHLQVADSSQNGRSDKKGRIKVTEEEEEKLLRANYTSESDLEDLNHPHRSGSSAQGVNSEHPIKQTESADLSTVAAVLPEYNFSDHLITQGIHTIEYVLGCVSNTASYLRLWALSLAHAQLASVFWSKMISQYGLETGNPVAIFIGFGVWACATFAVLLCMDVLECFLHALRLHWVEFQNKFFHADGYPFHPFSFKSAAEENIS